MQAVVARDLSKEYPGGTLALNGASFDIGAGEIFGFLGPNGSGKTTTVKMLIGVLSPTAGACEVFGLNPAVQTEKAHMISGVVTEHAQMYDMMSGLDNLVFYGTMFGLTGKEAKSRAVDLLERLELADASGKKLGAYSTGMRQRLSLARALIHRPRILFLDEPTSGLDPESAQNVYNLIRTLAKEDGVTVFLCTHQLRYAQEVCTQYGLISRGRMLATGTIGQLRGEVSAGYQLRLRASRYPHSLGEWVDEEGDCRMSISSMEEIPPLVRQIIQEGGDVVHVSATEPTLEEIYFALLEQRGGKEGNR